jgi:hypothetical protein
MGLDITGLGSVFDFGSKIIDKIWPNAEDAAKAKLAMLEMQQKGEFKELDAALEAAKGQMAINAEEAKSSSIFVAGWRPAAGWVCVLGLAYMTIFRPLASWLGTIYGLPNVPPVVDTTVLMELLFGMLGMGALRSYDKKQGTAS